MTTVIHPAFLPTARFLRWLDSLTPTEGKARQDAGRAKMIANQKARDAKARQAREAAKPPKVPKKRTGGPSPKPQPTHGGRIVSFLVAEDSLPA